MEPEFDQFASEYDRVLCEALPAGMAEDRYFAEYKVALMAKLLRDRMPARILDFGCGAGRSLTCLEQYFPRALIWGYDISHESLKVAAERTRRTTLVSDWAGLSGLTFDAILAANVFHHIPLSERVSALAKCREHLAEGGAMYVFEHNPYNPVTRRVFERCPFDKDAEMLTLHTAIGLAREARFSSARYGYTLFFPKPLSFLRRLEPLLRWVPLGAQFYVQLAR